MNIIWDWNGTLLNDVDICIKSMNHLLEKRNLTLLDINRDKAVFGFPVKDYYAKIGFDFTKENFEIPANEYMDWFHFYLPDAKLFSGAECKAINTAIFPFTNLINGNNYYLLP